MPTNPTPATVLQSDEDVAVRIAELARDMRHKPYEDFAEAVEPIIARHRHAPEGLREIIDNFNRAFRAIQAVPIAAQQATGEPGLWVKPNYVPMSPDQAPLCAVLNAEVEANIKARAQPSRGAAYYATRLAKCTRQRPFEPGEFGYNVWKFDHEMATQIVEEAMAAARAEGGEKAHELLAEWLKPQSMRLHAGELTAGELRACQAVLKGFVAALATTKQEAGK